jgi:glucose/arabinose dehydrogenase
MIYWLFLFNSICQRFLSNSFCLFICSFVFPHHSFGLAFDPSDLQAHPDVYFSSTWLFHKGNLTSSGNTISGKIRRASGPALDTVIDIITGLPSSRYDHGINGILFGDNGELYFAMGSNTNGGVNDGKLSEYILKESFLSASINVAYVSHPDFNGTITWSEPQDGNMIAKGIDIFAPGMRNPYGIMLHTNGNLYGTDNGPNKEFGSMSIGCNGEKKADESREDEINLIKKGRYYGSPNLKRAQYFNDPRQCVWRGPEQPDSDSHTSPILVHSSSIDGIMEFHGNHFGGLLRYNLIYTHYQRENNIFRGILTEDGQSILPGLEKQGVPLNIGRTGLDITQAPNGNLIEVSYGKNQVNYYMPSEEATTTLIVKTCWPYRGPSSGGSLLSIYGVNLNSRSPLVIVTVGGTSCPTTFVSETRVDCILPGGIGTVDIVLSNGASTSTFERGYRYITGTLPTGFVLPVYSG